MLKKLVLFLVILFVLYIIAIFNAPVLADLIGKNFGLSGFNQKVRDFKANLDGIPVQENLNGIYNNTLNGAQNITNETIGTVNQVKNGLDEVRGTLSGAVNNYNEVKTSIDATKSKVENGINSLKTTADTLKGVGFSVEDTMSGTLNNN